MKSGDIVGLVGVVMVFSIPLVTIIASVYKAKYKAQMGSLSATDREEIEDLKMAAKTMLERITTLESILDNEVPEWREEYERT